MSSPHGRDRLRPERCRRKSPASLKDLGQGEHRHVASYAVALAGDCRQFGHLGNLQICIGIVKLQRVGPAWKIGISPVHQNARCAPRHDATVVLRRPCQGLFIALDIELGMRLDPGKIKRGVIWYEIEHEVECRVPRAGRGTPPAPPFSQAPGRPHRRRWQSPIRKCPRPSDPEVQSGIQRAKPGCCATPPCSLRRSAIRPTTRSNQIPASANRPKVASSIVARVTGSPACVVRGRHSQTLVLIS